MVDLARLVEQSELADPSVVLERLRDGAVWSHAPARPHYPASMIKVPLAAAALLLAERGEIDERVPIPVEPGNLTANDGPSPLVAGYPASLDELLFLTIARSDNIGTNQLFDLTGRERASRLLRDELGLRETSLRRKVSGGHPLVRDPDQTGRNAHPAVDSARLFRLIALDAFPGAARLRTYLARQEWNTKLSAGLRPGDAFAHKTGDTEEVSHDGGILTTAAGERYVIVLYSASASSDATDARFAAFMQALRPALT